MSIAKKQTKKVLLSYVMWMDQTTLNYGGLDNIVADMLYLSKYYMLAKALILCRLDLTCFLFCLISCCGHANQQFIHTCTELDSKMDKLFDSIGLVSLCVHFVCCLARQSQNFPLFLRNPSVTHFGGHFVTEISLSKLTRHYSSMISCRAKRYKKLFVTKNQ